MPPALGAQNLNHWTIREAPEFEHLNVVLVVKDHLPMQEMQETRVQSLGLEDPLEKEMATHSSILAWEIPWTASQVGYSL